MPKNNECIFCEIVKGTAPSFIIWDDENFLAFLNIYPNTEGFTVLIPKKHYSSYFADVPQDVLTDLVLASSKVAKLLDEKLEDVGRTGLIFEGFGVNHLHAKLSPMHGTKQIDWKPIHSENKLYFDKYPGYLSSHSANRASDEELERVAKKIRRNN